MNFKTSLLFLSCSALLNFNSKAQLPQLRNGDLLFQNLDCGPLCDAIEEVTHGYNDSSFSHIGMVYYRNDSVMILEAIGKDVHLTALETFVKRSDHKIYVGRVKKQYAILAAKAADYAVAFLGMPYDDVFIYDNGKYYCSEMIYDAFKKANNDKPFFTLTPMTFYPPGKQNYYPAWQAYYKELNFSIPQGKPGINPGGISRSDRLDILN